MFHSPARKIPPRTRPAPPCYCLFIALNIQNEKPQINILALVTIFVMEFDIHNS